MNEQKVATQLPNHSHVFLGNGHEQAERRTWTVIALCSVMMVVEVVGGIAYGSIALTADGLHMFTHAGALLLTALAYRIARKRANDARFSFGTGKVGDLAGFTSAIVLGMIAVLIGYEAAMRAVNPVPIDFDQALVIAVLGLLVNVGSVWLLGHGEQGHHHGYNHHGVESGHRLKLLDTGALSLVIHEADAPPRFRIQFEGVAFRAAQVVLETIRSDGTVARFDMRDREGFLESVDEIPEPHAFDVWVCCAGHKYAVQFEEHAHDAMDGAHHRDNNMRAAVVHVLADTAVSLLVIVGLLFGRYLGWAWMDPAAGLMGALVIAIWSYGLVCDTGAILLDMTPDVSTVADVRKVIQQNGDRLADLHIWRLGPGHLGAIISVVTSSRNGPDYYKALLRPFSSLSHITVEVLPTSG